MSLYTIDRTTTPIQNEGGTVDLIVTWKVGFGTPASNQEIVRDVTAQLKAAPPGGGKLLLIDGPASLPVAFVLCHAVAHLFGAVAVRDPKLGGYIVCVSHDPAYKISDLVS